MSSLTEHGSWEPLPKRQKRSDRCVVNQSNCASSSSSKTGGGRDTASSSSSSAAEPDSCTNHQIVAANVMARAKIVKAESTLEGKDGCAGEFYEYLDHTADVQCHSWGSTLVEAFENMAPCMFNYMTDLSTVDIDEGQTITLTVKGHDLHSLLFSFMDELLFRFSTDAFVCVKAKIDTYNAASFSMDVTARGAIFDCTMHSQGTEIKAITYSNMQINEGPGRTDIYVIVDI